jgi:pimeloyl-ACP methyl ester carboxylesterase
MKRKIGKLSLNVEERGAGEVSLVFLHYWGGTHRTWNKVVSQLENSFRAVTYDMRGWGKSDPA